MGREREREGAASKCAQGKHGPSLATQKVALEKSIGWISESLLFQKIISILEIRIKIFENPFRAFGESRWPLCRLYPGEREEKPGGLRPTIRNSALSLFAYATIEWIRIDNHSVVFSINSPRMHVLHLAFARAEGGVVRLLRGIAWKCPAFCSFAAVAPIPTSARRVLTANRSPINFIIRAR